MKQVISCIYFVALFFTVSSCSSPETETNLDNSKIYNDSDSLDNLSLNDTLIPTTKTDSLLSNEVIDTIEVLVVICYNGYEYAMHGYDFNPTLESSLNDFDEIKVKPFPFKTLMGVSYQGVYDKKYCLPIIEKVDVDYLVLTRFTGNRFQLNNEEETWGYETRIVDCKNLTQINSLKASGLSTYEEIEGHIKKHIGELKEDLIK